MASPQDPPPTLRNDSAMDGDVQDPERVGLLRYTRVMERRPTSIELRLGILAFWFLCLASIGFGLFAGEQAKFQRSEPSHDRPIQIVTSTIFLSPTNSPSPPSKSGNVCASGLCVEVAGDLRRSIQWSSDPCEDFAKFSTARTRKPANDVISTEIDQVIKAALSSKSINPTTEKLRVFKSLCTNKTQNVSYSDYHPILRKVSTWISPNQSHSNANRFGAVLAYLHSASIPALFKTTATNYHFTLRPEKVSVKGIEDAFAALYPTDQVSERIAGVKLMVSSLSNLADESREMKSITIDELQDLTCPQSWIPCWIYWKDFYSALDPGRAATSLHVQGIDHFSQLGRILLDQPAIFLESYFHWLTIVTISKKDCQEELKLNFGPSLLKNFFLTSEQQKKDWENRTRSAENFLQSVIELSPNSSLPQVMETASIDEDQEQEFSSINSDNWVDTAFNLARIKTKKEFAEGQAYWNLMGTELKIVGGKVYFPIGALQPPMLYWHLDGVPKSLTFGSLGFNLFVELAKVQTASSSELQDTCQVGLSRSMQLWKKYKKENPREEKMKLVGLIDEVKDPDQLFYLAFARLGFICPGIEKNEDFALAFNCSLSK